MLRIILLFALSSLALGEGGVSGSHVSRGSAHTSVTKQQTPVARELKVLAEGFHSAITEPFVAVVRDEETYDKLRKRDANLPTVDAEFFQTKILIAAFLGERNTGGYSVEIIERPSGEIGVEEKAPGRGVMVPQMITSPFKVVSLAKAGMPAISLSLGETFLRRAQRYRISAGNFQVSGGFAGGTQSFHLAGKLLVTRAADLITIGFAIVSKDAPRERVLRDAATGII